MFSSRFSQILNESKSVLLVGCGGGYDIYAGLPFYSQYGTKMTLANISFAETRLLKSVLSQDDQNFLDNNQYVCLDYKTRTNSLGHTYPSNYVPEYWMSKALQKPVYAIFPNGVIPLTNIFTRICLDHNIDTILVIDAGVDSLLFGDEEDIGSFSEDMSTIVALSNLSSIPHKILVNTAWGSEARVSSGRFFENVNTLIRQNGLLGTQMLELDSKECQFYLNVMNQCYPENSTINGCLHASLHGMRFNEIDPWHKKRDPDMVGYDEFDITVIGTPLGALYWAFDLDKVVRNILYRDMLQATETIMDVDNTVHQFRHRESLVRDGTYIGQRKTILH